MSVGVYRSVAMDVESGNKPDDIQDGGNDLNGSEVKISLGERNGTPPPKEKETTSAADDTALENDGKREHFTL